MDTYAYPNFPKWKWYRTTRSLMEALRFCLIRTVRH
ncbi:unnamed protein product [Amoebophrya sp. A25]|nr:unnamed protein product [Amoebophrya sp. A25]|eukprot:GSA25T00016511001.1